MKPVINTILGGFGFIGSELCKSFGRDNVPYQVFGRQDPLPTGDLGNIYYCAGVTADFRSRHFDTIEAHVSTLSEVLKNGEYTSFLYLSSARIYRNESLTTEDSTISINPLNSEDFVDISKLAGDLHGASRYALAVSRCCCWAFFCGANSPITWYRLFSRWAAVIC